MLGNNTSVYLAIRGLLLGADSAAIFPPKSWAIIIYARFWSDLRDIPRRLPGRNPAASNRPILHDPHNQHSSATLIINPYYNLELVHRYHPPAHPALLKRQGSRRGLGELGADFCHLQMPRLPDGIGRTWTSCYQPLNDSTYQSQ